MMKRVLIAVLALVLLVSSAFAESTPRAVEIQTVAFQGNNALDTVIYTTYDKQLQPQAFRLEVGGNEAEVAAIASYDDTDRGRTWIFAVDTFENYWLAGMKTLVQDLVEQMSSRDNGAVITSQSTQIRLYNDKAALKAEADSVIVLEKDRVDTYFDTISMAQAFLNDNGDVKERAVLVLITNGLKRSGTPLPELLEMSSSSRTTVYTIAMAGANSTKLADYVNFDALATNSRGGLAFDILGNDTTNSKKTVLQDTVAAITENENNFYVLTSPLQSAWDGSEALTLQMVMNGTTYESSLALTKGEQAKLSELSGALVTAEPEPVEDFTDEPEEIEAPTEAPTEAPAEAPTAAPDQSGLNMRKIGLVVLGVCAALLVILTIALVVRMRKPPEPEIAPGPDVVQYEIKLERLGAQPANFAAMLTPENPVLLGRQEGPSVLVIPDDPKISRVHAKLYIENGSIYLSDQKSMNSSKVNNRPITPFQPVELHQNDIITVGLTDLRITW